MKIKRTYLRRLYKNFQKEIKEYGDTRLELVPYKEGSTCDEQCAFGSICKLLPWDCFETKVRMFRTNKPSVIKIIRLNSFMESLKEDICTK